MGKFTDICCWMNSSCLCCWTPQHTTLDTATQWGIEWLVQRWNVCLPLVSKQYYLRLWSFRCNKTFASLAPEIGSWLKICTLAPHLNPGTTTDPSGLFYLRCVTSWLFWLSACVYLWKCVNVYPWKSMFILNITGLYSWRDSYLVSLGCWNLNVNCYCIWQSDIYSG